MKKIFSLVAAMCVSFALYAATTVSFDFSDASAYGYANPAAGAFTQVNDSDVLVKDSVTLTVNFAEGNGFRFFAHSTTGVVNLRGYVNSHLTVACPEGKVISNIQFAGQNLTAQYVTVEDGTYNNGIWDGEAAEVTFNIIKSTVQINTLIVTYGESGEGPAPMDTIGVTEALARIDAGNVVACYVKGVVATTPSAPKNGNTIFWMTDIENPTDSLEGYRIFGLNGDSLLTQDDIPVSFGDTVLLFANSLMLYNNYIYEINGGYVAEILGKAPINVLEFGYADVRYMGTEDDVTTWVFTFSMEEEVLPGATFSVTNHMTRGIAGRYYTTTAGGYVLAEDSVQEMTSFSFNATYAGQGDNYNIYAMELLFATESGMYRYTGQMEVAGYTSDYAEPYALTDDQPYIPQAGDTLTCEQAKEYTLTLEDQVATEFEVTVIGYVTDNFGGNVSKGQQSFWLDDVKDSGKKTFQGYYCNLPDKTTPVPVGAKLAITGKLMRYGSNAEMKNGNITYIEGEPTPEERDLNILPVPDEAITVAEAMAIGTALEDNTTSEESYTVVGYIAKVAYQTANDTASWYMTDEKVDGTGRYDFEAYKCAIDNLILVGDYVFVTGQITKYVGQSGSATIEIKYGEAHFANAPSAIENVTAQPAALDLNQPMYNTLGQPVDATFRGIVIQNGHKYLLY